MMHTIYTFGTILFKIIFAWMAFSVFMEWVLYAMMMSMGKQVRTLLAEHPLADERIEKFILSFEDGEILKYINARTFVVVILFAILIFL